MVKSKYHSQIRTIILMLYYLDLAGYTIRLCVLLKIPIIGLGGSNLDLLMKCNTNLD